MIDIEKLTQTELDRADQEHHTPTAGAMISHVVANLWLHQLKIEQATLFVKKCGVSLFLTQAGPEWQAKEADFIHRLNQALADEGDLVPTTSHQILEYTMLKESLGNKFKPARDQLFDLIQDFDTQLMFITRAIELAQKEHHYAQAALLVELYGWQKAQIRRGQTILGHNVNEGLASAEEDDDED